VQKFAYGTSGPRHAHPELCNIFAKPDRQPTAQQMGQIYRKMRRNLPAILRKAASDSLYKTRVFKDLGVVGKICAERIVL